MLSQSICISLFLLCMKVMRFAKHSNIIPYNFFRFIAEIKIPHFIQKPFQEEVFFKWNHHINVQCTCTLFYKTAFPGNITAQRMKRIFQKEENKIAEETMKIDHNMCTCSTCIFWSWYENYSWKHFHTQIQQGKPKRIKSFNRSRVYFWFNFLES